MYKFNVDEQGWPTHAWGDEWPAQPVFSNFPFYRIDLLQWYVWNSSSSAWSEMAGAGITVEESDGAPSVDDVDTIKFDQSDGFSVTDGGDGSITVALSDSHVNFTKTGIWTSPSGTDDAIVWRVPFACTVTNVRGFREGGTSADINASKNGTATEHLASDLTLSSADSWTDGGAVQNTSYVAGDYLVLRLKSLTGSPTRVVLQVDFTRG
jgi:hypothetical protein